MTLAPFSARSMILLCAALLGALETSSCRGQQPAVQEKPRQVPERAPAAPPVTREPCSKEEVLVEGQYCTKVEQRCLRWLDDPRLPFARCAAFAEPSRCVGARLSMRFCIDRYEYTTAADGLPQSGVSFKEANLVCQNRGKRVCSESEWNFACEGENMWPYPYGFARQPVCNQDRTDLLERTAQGPMLRDFREPAAARPRCVSPFGVYNMVGNLDEPVLRDSMAQDWRFRSALKGGWWMPARNRCRPATTGHDIYYRGFQVGIRCCADASR
jgi:hypothetical protein